MLDANAYEHEGQRAWLEADLAAARAAGARALFAVTHDGPYARALHGGNRYAAEHYVPVLARYGVTLLFSGHDHYYQRGRAGGIDYIVSGGGGAPLYRPRCGVRGKRRCKVDDGMLHAAVEHHYVMVTVSGRQVTACPKRLDGSPIEPCAVLTARSTGGW
jgi:3',5'-cyclic AMP phosphodiesterase CpdA